MFRCFVIVVHCTHSLVSFSCTRFLFGPTTFSPYSRVLLKGMDVVVSSAVGSKIVTVIYLLLFNSRLAACFWQQLAIPVLNSPERRFNITLESQ
jgi:hypothetical protein